MMNLATRCKALTLLAVIGLSGCSIFDDEEAVVKVKELQPINASVNPKVRWEASVGDGIESYYSRLSPTVQGDLVIAADRRGLVQAFDRVSGAERWQVNVSDLLQRENNDPLSFSSYNLRISGGLVSTSEHVIFGTERGDLIALKVADGALDWHTFVGEEILADPAVGEGYVVVKTGAGSIIGFREESGEQLWKLATEVPALSLRGTSSPVVTNGGALFGTATGKLSVVILENGLQAWEARLAVPKGATELQRLVDSDSKPVIFGGVAYSIAFNGQLSAVELSSGRVLWAREYSSFHNFVIGGGRIFLSDTDDSVFGLALNGGIEQWSNHDYTGRNITGPAYFANTVVVGDEYGYLHFLNQANGETIGRLDVDDEVYTAPVVAGDTLYVQTRDGTLLAVGM